MQNEGERRGGQRPRERAPAFAPYIREKLTNEKFRPTILEKEVETCCICAEVPLNVVCCPECDNGPFCKPCFGECLERNDKCPTCNQKVSKPPGVNKVLQKLILKYAAQCSHEGCQKEGSLEQILNHMKNCEKRLVACKNQTEGCTVSMRKEVMEEHEAQCQFTRLQCSCGASLLRKEDEEHQQTICPTFPVACDLCFKRVPRNQLAEHQTNHCIKRTVKCINSDVGCSYADSYESYKQLHESSCPYKLTAQGTRSLLELTKSMSLRIEKLEQKAEEQAMTVATLKQQNEKLEQKVEVQVAMIAALKQQNEELASSSFQRKGTANVVMSVDFSKYQPKDSVFSEDFKIAELICQLKLYPKGCQQSLKNSEVYLRVNSIMGNKEFLIVLKFRLEQGAFSNSSINFFAGESRGWEIKNEQMLTRNGIETLEFTVSVEVLDVLLVGEEAQKVEKVYKDMVALEKQKSFGIENGVCTGTTSDADQEIFKCKTCNIGSLCQVCAKKCHQTHNVVASRKKNSRCYCSRSVCCKVLPFRKWFEKFNKV